MPTKLVFNAATQEVEEAELSVDSNGEILVTFADGGFIKLAAGETIEHYQSLLDLHHTDNFGQISVAKQEALVQALADFNTPLPAPDPAAALAAAPDPAAPVDQPPVQ